MNGAFHPGELAVQRAAGEAERAVRVGRGIGHAVVPAATRFIESQSVAVAASVDRDGQPWCSILIGPSGSFTVPEPATVVVSRRARASVADPLWDNLRGDPRLGMLFIEPARRRRYRVNGRVQDPDADPLVVEVSEAYPNCPKYIRRRRLLVEPLQASSHDDVEEGERLTRAQREALARADMLFLATADPQGDLDASHRGGAPGFVAVLDDRSLWLPDYAGNSLFNTFGNLRQEPRAGLLLLDFARAQSLQVTGRAELQLDADPGATGGTGRAWTFTVQGWRRAGLGAGLRPELLDR